MDDKAEKPVVSLDVSFGESPPQGMVTPLCHSLSELCRPLLADDRSRPIAPDGARATRKHREVQRTWGL